MFKIMLVVVYALNGPAIFYVTDKEFAQEGACLAYLETCVEDAKW